MNTMSPVTLMILLVVAAIVVIAIATLIVRQQRTSRLRRKFGNEYDLAVSRLHSRSKAEAELLRREERVARLRIVALTRADADRYARLWEILQSRFVDDPRGSVLEADKLVVEVMEKRGYPMGEFESMAADISVRYPNVVSNYRMARDIAARSGDQTDTEELRRALVHYRSLFDEMLGSAPKVVDPRSEQHIPVHP
jgi:hypothetical protein